MTPRRTAAMIPAAMTPLCILGHAGAADHRVANEVNTPMAKSDDNADPADRDVELDVA